MLKDHFHHFSPICVVCKTNNQSEHNLVLQVAQKKGTNIEEGHLYCPKCKKVYPILHGIPILVPNPEAYIQQSILHITQSQNTTPFFDQWVGESCGPGSSYDLTKQYLSTYMWAHYNDQNPSSLDQNPSNFSQIVQEMINPCLFEGPQIDLGCSVGRGTFIIAQETQHLTLGLDINFSMLRAAQQIKKSGSVTYRLRQHGTIYSTCTHSVTIPPPKLVDFWAVDAQHLPFADKTIYRCHSTNLIDCLDRPHDHLQELARVHNPLGYISLATPFDWSSNATPYEHWIGGHGSMYPLQGEPIKKLQWLLSAQSPYPDLRDFEIIQEQDNIPWRIRLHNRSIMQYNLHLMSVRRNNGLSSTC